MNTDLVGINTNVGAIFGVFKYHRRAAEAAKVGWKESLRKEAIPFDLKELL